MAMNLPAGFVLDNNNSSLPPGFILDKPPAQQPAEQPMTLGGFKKNLGSNTVDNLQGAVESAAPVISTLIPGYGVGRKLAGMVAEKIQGKPVTMPDTGSSPIPQMTGEQAKQAVVATGKDIYQAVRHPVKYTYEKPINQAMNVAMLLGGIKGTGKLLTKTPEKLVQEATSAYRTVLRPTQGEIKNIEVRNFKDINDSFKLAAEEKLPIESTPDKKLNTEKARAQLADKQAAIHESLNNLLENNHNFFDLTKVAEQAKIALRDKFKNALEYKSAKAEVDDFINAEIENNGSSPVVSAKKINDIKQGMWQVGYNAMEPTASKTARMIGHVAKEEIEKGIADPAIKALNTKSGQYATLNNILENAHGRVVPGGRLGGYFSRAIGAIVGHSTGIPIAGPVIGEHVGGKIAEMIQSPERISRIAAQKMTKAEKLLAPKTPTPTVGSYLKNEKGGVNFNENIENIVNRSGGQYKGIQQGLPGGNGEPAIPDMVVFNEPLTGSTKMLPISEATPENIKLVLAQTRKEFAGNPEKGRTKGWILKQKAAEIPRPSVYMKATPRYNGSIRKIVNGMNDETEKIFNLMQQQKTVLGGKNISGSQKVVKVPDMKPANYRKDVPHSYQFESLKKNAELLRQEAEKAMKAYQQAMAVLRGRR